MPNSLAQDAPRIRSPRPSVKGPSRGRPARGRVAVWTRGVIGALVLFCACELLTRLEFVSTEFLPYASRIAVRVPGLLAEGDFLAHLAATLQAWAIATVIAVAIAVPAGIALGSSPVAYRITRLVIELLRPIPSVTLIPLLILLVGPALEMKVVVAVFAALWPILFNAVYAIHDVDPVAKDTARSYGLSRLGVLRRVALPSAGPLVAAGVRVAAGIALTVVISAELLTTAGQGLGTYIKLAGSGIGEADTMFAGAVVAGGLGFAINAIFQTAERRLFFWSSREERSA
ncbi:ABC transporter permease [Actinomadura madurae]|uniref:ABC transporter permease n=1 Tax=Actinomadura madurae TaxID=1993 RepID=UPI0020D20167|nr:ABC transporter permease [Actinomadura madurae]MCP9951449.1 ABC transporter permease [Actinomadura madurae]